MIEGREEREKFGKNLFYVLIWLGEESMRERRDAERERGLRKSLFYLFIRGCRGESGEKSEKERLREVVGRSQFIHFSGGGEES